MENLTTLENCTEQELISLYKNGNSDAFGELFRRHDFNLKRYIKEIHLDTAQVEDVAQDTFEKAMRFMKEGKFPNNKSFQEWLENQAKSKTIQILQDPDFVCLNQCMKQESQENYIEEFELDTTK